MGIYAKIRIKKGRTTKQVFYEGINANINFGRVFTQNPIFRRVSMQKTLVFKTLPFVLKIG